MYVAVKGGETAILNSYRLLAEQRRGDTAEPELSVAQIRAQLKLAVDRVMTEGSVYDPELAALAIKQASGDLVEAIFLLRAYRATLPRLGTTRPLDTARMVLTRRISATFKDLPGGQVLGPTYDYTQRLLDFTLLARGDAVAAAAAPAPLVDAPATTPRVVDLLNQEGLIETRPIPEGDPAPADLTREPLRFPANRATRLQNLARGDEGFLLAMAYSTQRGYAHSHPSWASCAWARWRWRSSLKSWALPSPSAIWKSPNARWSTSSRAASTSRRSSRAAMAWPSATASARPWP